MPAVAKLVQRFWALYEARRWADAAALLQPDAACTWWATRERFTGAEAIVHVNAVYPEGWRIHLLELNLLPDGRVHTLVRVDHGESACYANSFFTANAGLIARIDEYWSNVEPPPGWRSPASGLPGQQHLARDERPGLAWRQ